MNLLARILAWTLALALVALPVVALVNGWIGVDRWPLRTLRVEGKLTRVDPALVRKTVLPYAARGFFAMRLGDAQAAVAALPWVERAEVRKRWPDVVEVVIAEHRPFARWGESQLLSEHGRVFPLQKDVAVPPGLPLLDGPVARIADVVALYNAARELFAPARLDVSALALDGRGSWSLRLSNGTQVVVGSTDAKSRLQRFAALLPRLLAEKPQALRRADLRYTNGFALDWASGREQADAGKAPAAARRRTATDGRPASGGAAVAAPRMASISTRSIPSRSIRVRST